jgi:hypothetical protein
MAKRVAKVGDLWDGMLVEKQSLRRAAERMKGMNV